MFTRQSVDQLLEDQAFVAVPRLEYKGHRLATALGTHVLFCGEATLRTAKSWLFSHQAAVMTIALLGDWRTALRDLRVLLADPRVDLLLTGAPEAELPLPIERRAAGMTLDEEAYPFGLFNPYSVWIMEHYKGVPPMTTLNIIAALIVAVKANDIAATPAC